METLSKALTETALTQILKDLEDKKYPIKGRKFEEVAKDILDGKIDAAAKMIKRFEKMESDATVTGFLGVLKQAHQKEIRIMLQSFPSVSKETAKAITSELFDKDQE